MADGPLTSSSRASPVVSLIDQRAVELLLQRAGYRRVEPSRLGDSAGEISLWEGRNLFVILMPERLVVGCIGAQDWRIRCTLDRIDPELLCFIRVDAAGTPPATEDVPDSGTWPTR